MFVLQGSAKALNKKRVINAMMKVSCVDQDARLTPNLTYFSMPVTLTILFLTVRQQRIVNPVFALEGFVKTIYRRRVIGVAMMVSCVIETVG